VRKIVVYELLSLDGVAEAPDTFFGWDDAVDAKLAAEIPTQDAVILGRRTYNEWAGFWPCSEIEPFATFINGITKYVATPPKEVVRRVRGRERRAGRTRSGRGHAARRVQPLHPSGAAQPLAARGDCVEESHAMFPAPPDTVTLRAASTELPSRSCQTGRPVAKFKKCVPIGWDAPVVL
jgi:hypothetical protein